MPCMRPPHTPSAITALAVLVLAAAPALSPAFALQQKAPPAPAATIPGFSVAVTYSQKAMDTLTSSKETVIVAAYLTGSPKPGTPKSLIHQGAVGLGDSTQEITPGATATFSKISLDPKVLSYVDSQGPQLLINVYSGRKSSPNNLLDCGIYDGPLKDVQGKSIPIACKLIGE